MKKVEQVAYFIAKTMNMDNDKMLLSMIRLQNILYLCDVEHMKKNKGLPLFEDNFFCWQFSPVVPEVYIKNIKFGKYAINNKIKHYEINLSFYEQDLITEVVEQLKGISTKNLSILVTQKNRLWKKYFDYTQLMAPKPMNKKEIYRYYKNTKLSDMIYDLELEK